MTFLTVAASLLLLTSPPRAAMRELQTVQDPKKSEVARVRAANALGESKDPKALAALARALDNTSDSLKEACVNALRALGAAPHFQKRLSDPKLPHPDREEAARVLRHLREPKTAAALGKALLDEEPSVRREAAHALAMFGAKSQRAALEKALSDESSDVRYFVVIALSALPDAKAALEKARRAEQDETVKGELDRVLGR